MKIVLSGSHAGLTSLEDPENFGSFGVFISESVSEPDEEAFMTVFAEPISSKEIWVRISEVKRLVPKEVLDRGWDDHFLEMLRYASAKGWMSSDGYFVKAHVVRSPSGEGIN